MPRVEFEKTLTLLKEFTKESRRPLSLILLGGLALHTYGATDRVTGDLDAEAKGDLEGLARFLNARGIPADLGENISGWSVIAMPPGYRDRAVPVYEDPLLVVKALSPLDFIVSKLRRFTEEDIQDALFIAEKYRVRPGDIERLSEAAVQNSTKDTALFLFRKNVRLFLQKMTPEGKG